MHTTINYAGLTEDQKKTKAIEDIKDFRGAKWYDDMTELFRAGRKYTYEQFALAASIGGIQGYPVKVWYDIIWPE